MLSTALEKEREKNRLLQREVESLRGELSIAKKILRDSGEASQLYTALQKAKVALENMNGFGKGDLTVGELSDYVNEQCEDALATVKECGVE